MSDIFKAAEIVAGIAILGLLSLLTLTGALAVVFLPFYCAEKVQEAGYNNFLQFATVLFVFYCYTYIAIKTELLAD